MKNSQLQQLEQLLSTLISFRTVSRDQSTNHKAIDWIKEQLTGLPLHIRTFEFNGFPALIATTRQTETPILWLQAHLDVVPGSDDSFTAQLKGKDLHGRGAFDMKFAIASYILLVQQLGPKLVDLDVGIMITTDEELGGTDGVKALVERGFTSDVVFLPDGGNNWEFVSASRGIWHFELTATGATGHGSRPWLGHNAILALMNFIGELQSLFPSEPCQTPNHFHDSMNVGMFNAGKTINQIPGLAQAGIDVRYLLENENNIKNNVNALLQKHPDISLVTVAEGAGYKVDNQNPFFKIYSDIMQRRDIKCGFDVTYGSSDARFFTAIGIPVIVIRPDGGGLHSENEFINLHELSRFHDVLVDFVQQSTNSKK